MGPTPIWLLNDGGDAQCPGIAKFIQASFGMVGINQGEIRYCMGTSGGTYAAPTAANGTVIQYYRDVPGTTHPATTTHDDHSNKEGVWHLDGSNEWNTFEASVYVGNATSGRYYIGYLGDFATPKEVVKKCFTVHFRYRGPAPKEYHTCTDFPWTEAP